MFLSRDGARELALETVNVSRVDLAVDRIYRNNLFLLFQNYGYNVFSGRFSGGVAHVLGDRVASRRLTTGGEPNAETVTRVDLSKAMREGGPGLYKVSAKLPETWDGDERWVLATDIGLAAKKGEGELLVWAASFADAEPMRKVKVSLISDQNQVIGRGTTDARGLCRIKLPRGDDAPRPFMLLAEKGRDLSFLLLDRFRTDMAGLDVGGQTISTKGYSAFMYGERDIYRPGETVEAVAVVRGEDLQPPQPAAMVLEHRDPQGRLLSRRSVTPDMRGMAAFSLDLPAYALTGGHSLDLMLAGERIGQYRFQVEEFIPDRIKVRVDPKRRSVAAGEKLPFAVEGDYLFGAPAADLQARVRVRLVPEPFVPEGFEGYVFQGPQPFEARKLLEEKGRLNADGMASFSAEIPDGLQPPSGLRAELAATVLEAGGRGVTAMQPVTVHAYPRYVGLKRLGRRGYQPGDTVELSYVVATPAGNETAPERLTAELYQDRWRTIMRRTPSGGFRYESVRDATLVESKDVPAAAAGEFAWKVPDVGAYRVVLKDPRGGAASQVSFFAGGFGYSPWALENPARLELVPDKKEYKPGETARVQVRAPFPGRALVTVEQRGIKRAQELAVKGNTAEVRIPVEASDAPNVYVCATLVRPASELAPGEAGRAVGAAPLFVNRDSHRLPVSVEAPDTARPETPVELTATTRPGARVTIAAVDEGILQLIDQKTPNPFDFFYAKRALEVDWMDTFSLLLPDLETRKASPGGGEAERRGRFMSADSLRRVKPAAFFSGVLTANDQGVARFSLTLPELQGAMRIMAVAADGDDFGAGQAVMRVKSPLVATPSFPRFLGTNETLVVPVSVRNDTPSEGNVTVRLTAEGAAAVDEPERTVAVARGAQETVRFTLRTGQGKGVVALKAEASGNNETASVSAELPLRPPLPLETASRSGSLKQAATTFAPANATRYAAGTVSRELAVGRLPMVRFTHNLRQLLGYPYGCAEQIVSRAFPLIHFGDMAETLAPDLLKKTDPAALVQSAVSRLASMQAGGGFSMWPGQGGPDPFVSIYAAHFLAAADQAGFRVPDYLLNQVLQYIRGQTRPGANAEDPAMVRAAYACYVLAFAGRPDRGAMDHLHTGLGKDLPRAGQVLLAGSYALAGEKPAFQDIMANLRPARKESGRENLGSPLRNAAMVLTALLRAAPEDPLVPALAARVASMLEARDVYSTQENAFGLMALGAWWSRQSLAGDYSGEVLVAGEKRAVFDQNRSLALSGLPGNASIAVQLAEKPEPGTIFWSLGTRGSPTLEAYRPVSEGLSVSRRLLDEHGEPLGSARAVQGDLVVLEVSVQSLAGPVDNTAVTCLLPAGLEPENQRLASRDSLPWIGRGNVLSPAYVDVRDDRVLLFADLPGEETVRAYALLRAVTQGDFVLPPARAESMYDPSLAGSGEVGRFKVVPAR
jgi:hypothetical protein